MDSVNNWKIILLQWIKECGFLENNFYSIEQTEIEVFFLKLCEQIKGNINECNDLSSFLKEHYPRFEPHFDDENAISNNDYIYVYSLFLHFSCVKCPDEFFQRNCQHLKPAAQENITTFLKELLHASALTKEALRHAIASTSTFKSPRLMYMDSPIRTPRKTGISPPTPRSCKLQEKSKELISLKAQLENEAYEKGMLELEVKQNQDKIFKLTQELKRTHQDLQRLKNDVLSTNTDDCDSEVRYSEGEQTNRRLSKQISQKEMEIAKQQGDIDTLTEQKDILTKKLQHAERQIKILQNKIEEFALKVDELSSELEQKDFTIQCLLEHKVELENYIAETRSSSASSRPDLNTSVECLDLSRTTNSSGSVNSPENLGSVVDIQLREKENENVQLREEMAMIRMDNAKLSKQMTDLTVRCSKSFDICNENLIIDHESSGPLENFIVFSNYIENFVHKYEENCIAMGELKENAKVLNEQNHLLSCRVAETQSEVDVVRKELNGLQNSNKALEITKIELEKAVDDWKNKLEISLSEEREMREKLKSLQSELDNLKILKSRADQEFEQRIEELKSSLELSHDQFTQTKIDYEHKLQAKVVENHTLVAQIEQLNRDGKMEKTQYEAEMNLLRGQLEESSKAVLQHESIIRELEIGKQRHAGQINDLNSQLENVQKQLEKVQTELVQMNNVTIEREREIGTLTTELEQTKHNFYCIANEKEKLAKEAEDELREKEMELQRLTEDIRQQSMIVSKVQVEKEALINSTQQRLDLLSLALDQCANLFKEQEERLACTSDELKLRQAELDEVSSNFIDLEGVLAERTKDFVTASDRLTLQLKLLAEHKSLLPVVLDSADVNDDEQKRYLNQLIQRWHNIGKENAHLSDTVSKLTQQKIDAERQISELREHISESQCECNKLVNEVKRLTADISNLENVCDHLSDQNSVYQTNLSELKQSNEELVKENCLLKKDSTALKIEHEKNISLAEPLKKAETALRAQVMEMQSTVKRLSQEVEGAHSLLAAKTREHEQDECIIDLMKSQISELESKVVSLDGELKEKYDAAHKILQKNCEDKCINLEESLQAQIDEKQKILNTLNDTVDKLTKQNSLLDDKCHLMTVQLEQSNCELLMTKSELFRLQCEETKLLAANQLLTETNNSSQTLAEKYNKEILEQKDNVSRLIGEVASIRREKDAAEEEKTRLLTKLAETVDMHQSLNASYKSILDKLQVAEKEVLAKQTSLKSEQIRSQDLDSQLKKLQIECTKLRESEANINKRMQKQALKLGDTQAANVKLKKEVELAQSALEAYKNSTEAIQRENVRVNSAYNTLKDKLSKCEKANEQLASKLQALTKAHELLAAEKGNLEASDNELKSTKAVLEKSKSNLEDKVRKLAKSLSDSNAAISRLEQDKVRLSLEVGGLNNQLQEANSSLNMKLKENRDITANLIEAKSAHQQLKALNDKLETDAKDLCEENSQLNDRLSKLALCLEIAQGERDSIKTQLEALKAEIVVQKTERNVIEKEHLATLQRLNEVEKLADERTEFVEKIKFLETKLADTSLELTEMLKQEQITNAKLNNDINIFQSKLLKSRAICEENELKWAEEKEQMLNEMKASDDRIKETRLELEGKLEKMKNKMKTLYNDEITKIKSKQERELAVLKSDCETLKAQNAKYEEHTKKLSSQIFKLNENILEHQKQNTFLKTKLKDLESKSHQFNRITSSHVPQSSAHQALSSNLHMEDEEGEIFNNTYLSDLKNGRMSDLFSREICTQELQYRNSMLPPHLKSTYLAQFDHQMGEDEIREIPSLDDSSSTLLNTGQRKKVSGATSYKRPGPPTPSKNAGRLSFGGNGELNREILKESLDTGNYTLSSKTPAKFKLFSSRIKDENKHCVMSFKRKKHVIGTIQCSSTPRKSKAHFDQRRLLDQIMSAPADSPLSLVSPAVHLPPTLTLTRRLSQKLRPSKLSCATPDSGSSDINSPIFKDAISGCSKPSKRYRDRRSSLYLRGTMFSRNCRTPTIGFRETFKNKSKMQRNATFNKYRREVPNQLIVKKSSFRPSSCNNNSCCSKAIIMNNFAIEESKEDYMCSPYNSGISDDIILDDKSSKHFQQLLTTKESHAPFEISEINGPSYVNSNSNSFSAVHSRIIYGASVILNRRIPNVNTTLVRKSSIYVKAKDGQGIILVTNQSITLMDLAQMWIQMNVSAKIVISISLITLCVFLLSIVIQFLL